MHPLHIIKNIDYYNNPINPLGAKVLYISELLVENLAIQRFNTLFAVIGGLFLESAGQVS